MFLSVLHQLFDYMTHFGCFCEFYINNLWLFFTVFTVKWNWEFIQALQGRQQKKIKKIK